SEGRKSWQDAGAVGRPHYSALAVALIRYLQVNFPLDLEMLVQVHCCFGLEAELAVLLEGKAGRLAQRLGRKWEKICSEEGEEQLLMCLSLYLECAKLFLKGKRYQRQLVANELAALVCLQLKAVQINLAVSLNEQQNAAISLRQEIGDWKEVSSDGPEALAAAMVDASGLGPLPKAEVSGGSLESAESDNGDADALAEVEGQDSETKLAGAEVLSSSSESPTAPPSPGGASAVADSLVPTLNLGPAGDIFVVVNLEEAEVEVFAEYHQDFIAAFEVVSAYRHSFGDSLFKVWPRALYRQVVLLGSALYFQLFLQHLPLAKEWLEAVVKLYLNEPCPEQYPLRAKRMKQFMREGIPNLETRHQLARQLGSEFKDISIETASLVYMD
ncbi:unnamed protein product, partial [Polarella glacialis]